MRLYVFNFCTCGVIRCVTDSSNKLQYDSTNTQGTLPKNITFTAGVNGIIEEDRTFLDALSKEGEKYRGGVLMSLDVVSTFTAFLCRTLEQHISGLFLANVTALHSQ